MAAFTLWDFSILSLLFFVIIFDIMLLPNEMTKPDSLSSNYSPSTIVYAQQQQHQQPVFPVTNNQEWIDKQSNTKVLFTYSPENPLVGGFTELKFDIEDSKTGTHLKDVFARVTIIDGQQQQQQVPLKFYSMSAPNGHFSINYQFPLEGTYQIFVKVESKYSALTLASFKMFIPFRPVGVININHIFPILIPAGLAAIIGIVAIILFMVLVNKRRKGKDKNV